MTPESRVILNIADADCDDIGNKARRLAKLLQNRPSLFSVPAGLVLLPQFSNEHHINILAEALKPIGRGPFAVRSCGLEEDGAAMSMAGAFYTELFIRQEGLSEAINRVRASFGKSVDTAAVLIQQMIEPEFAGVLFTCSPENRGLASCEYTKGTADAMVSGKVVPTRVEYGR